MAPHCDALLRVLLLVCVALFPIWLNLIPLSSLAAILIVTGFKLASPALFHQMWKAGRYQFAPFVLTVVAVVLTDLLVGVLIGLAVSLSFILWSNARRPIRRIVERHLGGEVVHIELANQVSFLNRPALARVFDEVPRGGHVLLDARGTDYIDPDALDLIRDYAERTGPGDRGQPARVPQPVPPRRPNPVRGLLDPRPPGGRHSRAGAPDPQGRERPVPNRGAAHPGSRPQRSGDGRRVLPAGPRPQLHRLPDPRRS